MIKKLTKNIMLLLTAFVFSAWAGCAVPQTFDGPEHKNITLIMKYITRDYRDEIISGAKTAANEYGYDISVQQLLPSDAASRQAQIMSSAVESGAEAVILIAEKTGGLEQEIKKRQNTPLILIDTEWAKDDAFCTVETDNEQMVKDVVALLKKTAKPDCVVYILNSVCPAGETNDKKQRLLGELAEYTGFNAVTVDYNTEHQTELKAAVESKLNEENGARAVIALDGFSAGAAIQAIKEQKQDIPLIAFGSTLDLVSEMENGKVTAMVIENAFTKGYIAVQSAAQAIKKEPVQDNILLKARVVTLENLYLPENQKLIFPLT